MATVEELVLHTRAHILRDTAAPHLWDTGELKVYLSQAEVIFCRRTHVLVAEDKPFAQVQTEPGKKAYDLGKKVVHVYEVLDETGRPLRDCSRSGFPKIFAENKPRAFTTARGKNMLTLSPTPDDEYHLSLLVAHLPEQTISQKGDHDEPEIPEEYQHHLCQYAAYKALMNNDPEGSNTVAAAEFLASWEEVLREAKRDVFRQRTPAGATVRTNWTASRRG